MPDKLNGHTLTDCVHKINSSRNNQDILKKWKDWFISKDIPFVITQTTNKQRTRIEYRLWKEDERLTPAQIESQVNKTRIKTGVKWFCDKKV